MLDKRNDRRLTLLLMLGLVAGGLLASAAPAEAQGRYRVLVPRLERQGDADKNFGRRTSDELRKLIDDLPTHAPVENRDLRDELRRFKLSEDDLSNCVTARQLAAQAGYELVMCGSYAAAPGGGFEVTAQFVNPKEVQSFDVPTFNVPDHKQAAQHIFTAFRDYIDQVTYVVYCTDALESGQWQTALENCNKVLELNDSHQTALYGRGYALMQLEQHDQALESLKKVLELNPIHQEALMAAGFVAAAMGRMEESRGYYREYLELNPGNAQVRLTIAMDAAKAGDNEGALEIAEAGLDGDAPDPVLMEYAGYFAVAAAQRMESSAQGGQNGNQLSPEVQALYNKAIGYFERVYPIKADSASATFLNGYMNALNKAGRTDEALEVGSKAVATHGDEISVWNTYATVLRDADRIDDALAALDKVLELDPSAENVRARQAQWLLQKGDLDRAKGMFRQAVDRGEIQSNAAALAMLSVGFNQHFQARRYDQAEPYLDSALEFATSDETKGMAHFFLGYIYYSRGEQVQAPSTAESAQRALPIFQQALRHFEASRPYAEKAQAQSLQQFLQNTQQFIEIQEALIKRGR